MPSINPEKRASREAKAEKRRLKRFAKKFTKGKKYRRRQMTPENCAIRSANAYKTQKVLVKWRQIYHVLQKLEHQRRLTIAAFNEANEVISRQEASLWKHLSDLNPGSCKGCGLFGGHFTKDPCQHEVCPNWDENAKDDDSDIEHVPGVDGPLDTKTVVRWGKDYTDEELQRLAQRYEAVAWECD